ncbi:MAG TPA: cell division protein FtsL [Verrucomicrobiae bacterium]|nr:cell division protein FtsL [Verrucomicrobiae bacterium]
MTRVRAAAQIQVNQRLVRERDRKHARELWRFLATAAVLAVPVLGYVWQRMDFLRVSKRYERLQQELQSLGEDEQRLRLERSTLMDHERIETLARRNLGLVDPAPDDVRNVRLFDVTGGAVERAPMETNMGSLPTPIITPSKGKAAESGPWKNKTAGGVSGGARSAPRPAPARKGRQ